MITTRLKVIFITVMINAVFMISSCSSNTGEEEVINSKSQTNASYNYSPSELETIKLINDYRVNIGLNVLKTNDYISYQCEGHNNYMTTNNVVTHNGFVNRFDSIVKVLGTTKVSENIAYNYKTSQAAVDAWLNSPGHKKNLEGDFNYFGISIREHKINGRKYYTNIFAKL